MKANKYAAIKQAIGQPDLFRLRYRDSIRNAIAEVIQDRLDKKLAGPRIGQLATLHVPPEDQPRFIEVAESELIGMHEGNFARYRIKPSEYYAWKQVWESGA
jgi:hypothetical protein